MLDRLVQRLGAVVFVVAFSTAAAFAQQLEVHVIDVDQGLSVFVKSPTGKRLLIDGGNPGDGNNIVKPYLGSIGVTGLDYSVMTHWHTDHFGGLTEVHNSAYKPLTAAYDRGDLDRPSNGFVTSYLSAVGAKRAIPTVGQVLDLGGGATATFISRDGNYPGGSVDASGDENAHSLGVVVRYGDFDLYVAGDLTAGGLSTPNVEGPVSANVGQVEVALASHHGSTSSSSAQVVANLNPSLVIHSAGHDNPYGHPTDVTVNNWSTTSATRVQWCTTDGDTVLATGGDPGGFNAVFGHIVITSDGNTFLTSSSSHPEQVRFATFEQAGTLVGPGQVVINELMVDPVASADAFGDWFELENVSSQRLNLGGMQFLCNGQSFTLRSQVLLDPNQRFVVGLDGRGSRNGDVFLGVGAPWQLFSLANGTSSLTTKSAGGTTLESVSWGGAGIPITPGVSSERKSGTGGTTPSNFASALTAWSGGDLGTPWAQNDNYQPACPLPIAYGTGKTTSNQTVPYITWSGTPDLNANNFSITMVDGMPLKSTIAFYGFQSAAKPFSGGTLWVQTPVKRMGVSTTDITGSVTYPIPIDPTMVGTKRYYQFWFRDPLHPDGTNVGLSGALEVRFCPLAPTPAAGDVIVSEFMKDPSFVTDANGEWFELYNTTNFTFDLEGWTVRDDGVDAFVIQNGGNGLMIAPHSFLVLGSNDNPATNGGVNVAYRWSTTAFALGNSDDEIVLVAPSGTEIDRINYDNGLLWPDLPGEAAELDPTLMDGVSNDNGNNWCPASLPFSGGNPDTGTPNAVNETCP